MGSGEKFLGKLSLRELERSLAEEIGDIRTRLAHGLEPNIEPWEEERVSEVYEALRAASEDAAGCEEFGLYLVDGGLPPSSCAVASGIVACNSGATARGMMMLAKPQGRYLRWIDSARVSFLGPWREEFRFLLLSPWAL